MTVRFDTERSLPANIDLGTRLKRLRTRQALSQKELAGMVGVTPSSISQIESNLIYPSLPALFKMAQVLSVDAGYFFQRDINGQRPIIFPGGGKEVRFTDLPKESIRGRHLLPADQPAPIEPYLIEIPAGKKLPDHFFVHKGEEFGYVMEGKLEVTVQNASQQLVAGDVIYLTRHIPSQWKNSGKNTAKLLWIKVL
jgi:transcriptional regulator with XRE-family HTH domain